ncbi:hypothetical protein FIBSPDRAFT_419347 [Athelia psychrophila]|uniref:Uncharacterized protein n=1 Tax=Athelia psychrophila TaxID=1759441 RepID=A0A166N5S9_9AGAM|nr:hypothetical protein FIBSPDRAFT_575644 [Fibularhizoctonia sp. CBS 109695]KZP24673.1 hypothetical protein FIBSPDRAFT_419347 [Fibularhizoctonia sp. CBS 109695]
MLGLFSSCGIQETQQHLQSLVMKFSWVLWCGGLAGNVTVSSRGAKEIPDPCNVQELLAGTSSYSYID